MAGPPTAGWLQRTTAGAGPPRLRFHRDRDCAERTLRRALDRGRADDGEVIGPIAYAAARRLGVLTLCTCPTTGGRSAGAGRSQPRRRTVGAG